MAFNFREALSVRSDEIERPKPLPVGHYYATIRGHEFNVSKQRQTPFVRFLLAVTEAADDVDPSEIEGIDLSRRELRKDYYITPAAKFRLADMLDSVIGQPNRTLDERLPDTRGQRVLIQVTQRTSDDGVETYNDVGTIVSDQEPVAAAA